MNCGDMQAERDVSKAVAWLQRACDKGDANAQYVLGTMFLSGRKVEMVSIFYACNFPNSSVMTTFFFSLS
jgi:TPR repeat protein